MQIRIWKFTADVVYEPHGENICFVHKERKAFSYLIVRHNKEKIMENFLNRDMKCLNYLMSEIEEVYHNMAVRLGVSDAEMDVLYTLCVLGDRCPLSDVARLSGSSRQTIHSAVKKLTRDGFICLQAKNGREKLVCLTKKGEILTEKTAQRIIGIENEIFDNWKKEEREQYLYLLQKYLNDLKRRVNQI